MLKLFVLFIHLKKFIFLSCPCLRGISYCNKRLHLIHVLYYSRLDIAPSLHNYTFTIRKMPERLHLLRVFSTWKCRTSRNHRHLRWRLLQWLNTSGIKISKPFERQIHQHHILWNSYLVELSCKTKEDGGIRGHNCPFGSVVKYNFKLNTFFQLNIFDIL